MEKVKVSPKGQVVIPKPLRDKFGIKEGQEVMVEGTKKGILVMKREDNPARVMVGLFEGKMAKMSVDLVKDIRKESEARLKQAKQEAR